MKPRTEATCPRRSRDWHDQNAKCEVLVDATRTKYVGLVDRAPPLLGLWGIAIRAAHVPKIRFANACGDKHGRSRYIPAPLGAVGLIAAVILADRIVA